MGIVLYPLLLSSANHLGSDECPDNSTPASSVRRSIRGTQVQPMEFHNPGVIPSHRTNSIRGKVKLDTYTPSTRSKALRGWAENESFDESLNSLLKSILEEKEGEMRTRSGTKRNDITGAAESISKVYPAKEFPKVTRSITKKKKRVPEISQGECSGQQ